MNGTAQSVSRRTLLGDLGGMALLATGAAGVLAACGPGGPAKQATFKEKTTLRYQSYKNPEELAVFMMAVERWIQRVGNVEVHTDIVPQGEYIEKLLVRIAGGDPPDVMEVNDRMSSDFIARGTLLDLTPLIKRDGKEVDIDDVFPGYRDVMLYKGKRYGLPDYCGPTVMYCNKRLFEQAAQPVPDENWTWERFLEVGRIITKDTDGDKVPNQFMTTNALGASKSWTPMVWWSFGGEIQKGVGPHHPSEVEWRIAQPAEVLQANARAVDYWGSLIWRHNIIPQPGQRASMREGTIATEIAGRWLVPPYKTWDWVQQGQMVMALPPKGVRPRRSRNSTLNATIPHNAKKPEAAWELAKFHAGKEGLTVAVEGQRTMSPRKSAVEAFRKSLLPWEDFNVYMKAQESFTQPMPMHYNWTLSEQVYAEELNAAYKGERPATQALKNLQARLEDLMKRGL